MTTHQRLTTELFLATNLALIEALETARAGMLAENTHQASCGNSIPYADEAFASVASDLTDIATKLNTTYTALQRTPDDGSIH